MNVTALGRRVAPLAVAAAAVLAWSPPPSLAASASASLTNITLTAFDTDLTDGVEAGFHFLPGQSGGGFHFFALNSVPQIDRDDGGLDGLDSPFSPSAALSGLGVGRRRAGQRSQHWRQPQRARSDFGARHGLRRQRRGWQRR